eukprot:749047-Prymnesium_polylepis.3
MERYTGSDRSCRRQTSLCDVSRRVCHSRPCLERLAIATLGQERTARGVDDARAVARATIGSRTRTRTESKRTILRDHFFDRRVMGRSRAIVRAVPATYRICRM